MRAVMIAICMLFFNACLVSGGGDSSTDNGQACAETTFISFKNLAEFGENMPMETRDITVLVNNSAITTIPVLASLQETEPMILCQAEQCVNAFFTVSFDRLRQYASPETDVVEVSMKSPYAITCGRHYKIYLLAEDFYLDAQVDDNTSTFSNKNEGVK